MSVPIRHVDFDRLEREVRRAVDPVGGYRGDDLYAAPILRSPDRPSALTTLFNALGSALASRHRRVADVDWEQPLVRALARVSGHPELPSPRFVLLTVTAPMEDAASALAARATAARLPWDVDAVKDDLVAQLRTVYGDERVNDSRTPTMKAWGAASATARALVILLALDELGRLRDAPPARIPAAAAVTPPAAPTADSVDIETIDLAHPPRTGKEAAFVLRVTPCARCGATDGDGVTVSGAGPIVLSVQCAGCRKRRCVRYATPLERGEPPPYHLARARGPSRVIPVERFAAAAARDLAQTVDDPAAAGDVAALDAGERALVRARTALTELAKFLQGDVVSLDGASASAQAARAANPERFTRAWIEAQRAVAEARTPRYLAARDVAQRERGAARGSGLAERGRAHARWLKAGRSGPGRFEMVGERWEGLRFGTPDLTAAVLRNANLARTTFLHATLHEAEIEQTSFSRASLVGVGLQRATLRAVDATGASLALGRLEGARIEGGTWQRTDLRRASLARARLVGVDLRGGNLAETVLDGATLERCDLRDVDLRHEAQWKRLGTARRTTFVECDLRGARVDAWRLDGAVFERCRMHGIIGVPEVKGALTVVDADLSQDGDGSVRGGVEALAGWRT